MFNQIILFFKLAQIWEQFWELSSKFCENLWMNFLKIDDKKYA